LEMLDEADILVVNAREIGFALTSTSFQKDDLDAIAAFVEAGGSLLHAGWSPSLDGSSMCGQFNAVLQQMRSSIRFVADELEFDDPGQIHTCREAGEGTGYPVYATEACPLTIEAGDGDSAVLVFARAADDPVFAASWQPTWSNITRKEQTDR